MEGEAVGRGDLAGSVAVVFSENRWHRVGGEASETDIYERADDAADHLMTERRGRDFKAQQR